MKYCPFMSYNKPYVTEIECLKENCALAGSSDGGCLIHRLLEQTTQEQLLRHLTESFKDTFANYPDISPLGGDR